MLDAGEIAAVVLAIRVARACVGYGIPLLRNAPWRRGAALAPLPESVDEYLVHDGVEMPARPTRVAYETEVAERGHLEWMDAIPVQAPVSASAARKKPDVRDDRAPQRKLCPPPDPTVSARRRRRFDHPRLAVSDISEHDGVGVAFGSPQAELGRVPQPPDVELGAVVVRLIEPRHAVANEARFHQRLVDAIHRGPSHAATVGLAHAAMTARSIASASRSSAFSSEQERALNRVDVGVEDDECLTRVERSPSAQPGVVGLAFAAAALRQQLFVDRPHVAALEGDVRSQGRLPGRASNAQVRSRERRADVPVSYLAAVV